MSLFSMLKNRGVTIIGDDDPQPSNEVLDAVEVAFVGNSLDHYVNLVRSISEEEYLQQYSNFPMRKDKNFAYFDSKIHSLYEVKEPVWLIYDLVKDDYKVVKDRVLGWPDEFVAPYFEIGKVHTKRFTMCVDEHNSWTLYDSDLDVHLLINYVPNEQYNVNTPFKRSELDLLHEMVREIIWDYSKLVDESKRKVRNKVRVEKRKELNRLYGVIDHD